MFWSAWSSASSPWDSDFEDAAETFLPGIDYRLLSSQAWVESRYIIDSRSPVGAMGILQIMPATWKDLQRRFPQLSEATPYMPEAAIFAAAAYMGYLHEQWSWPRPVMDRYLLSAASYNAGLGSILSSQALCGNKSLYAEIIGCLDRVTGRHAKETQDYGKRILERYMIELIWG